MQVELPTGTLALNITQSDYDIDELIGFAARNNSKRGFLFLSKVLGKHWPVKPSVMQKIHKDLALRLSKFSFDTPPYFIGMAETATALGRGVFEEFCLYTGLDSLYSHTTRYKLDNENVINFSEEHSHATDQWLHLPSSPKAKEFLKSAQHLVFVDDEMSTGKTFINLVKVLQDKMPNLKSLYIVTILDMKDPQYFKNLQTQIPFKIEIVHLMTGTFAFTPRDTFYDSGVKSVGNGILNKKLIPDSGGRFGVFANEWNLNKLPLNTKVQDPILVIGTGEFMYEPYRLALELESKGHEVYFQATTRSPILRGNHVKYIHEFTDNYGENLDNFIYNVDPEQYKNIYICYETASLPQNHDLPNKLNAHCCHLIH